MSCSKGMQLEHLTLTGSPEIYSDRSSARGTTKRSVVWANQTHRHATFVVAREPKGLFGLKMIDANMNTADMGAKYLRGHTEENVVGTDGIERLGMVTSVAASS